MSPRKIALENEIEIYREMVFNTHSSLKIFEEAKLFQEIASLHKTITFFDEIYWFSYFLWLKKFFFFLDSTVMRASSKIKAIDILRFESPLEIVSMVV